MFEYLVMIKLLVAIFVVLGLSIVTEKVSPMIAGILAGLPTGSAITLFFIALQNGMGFASSAAIYNMIGLVAMQALLLAYYLASRRFAKHALLLSAFFSILGYLIVAYLLHFLVLDPLFAVLLPLASIPVFIYLFRGIENSRIKTPIKIGPAVILGRAVAAALIILGVTEAARFVGPAWAGLLTAFPTTTFPLLLIVHRTYDVEHVHTIIKNFPRGLASLIAYSLAVSLAYPVLGLYWGTAAAFASALAVCIVLYMIHLKKRVVEGGSE